MFYTEEIKIEKAKELLEKCGLSVPKGVDYTVGVFNDDGRLAATGSLKGDMIQGIAVDPAFQGEDMTAKIFTHLIQKTDEESLYLFTKPDKVQQFVGLGMRHVATARPYAGLLEWGKEGVRTFQEYLKETVTSFTAERSAMPAMGNENAAASEGLVSCLVMNCNPFTRGHRYLIEKAAAESQLVYVFVVEENASLFSFEDRLAMVRLGTADLENVMVLGGGRYMISDVTFPSYFTKEEDFAAAHAAMDVEIFASCIAPVLNVNRRYVGTEPHSAVTAVYNEALKKRLPRAGVEVVEVPRAEVDGDVGACDASAASVGASGVGASGVGASGVGAAGTVISASKVRALLYDLLVDREAAASDAKVVSNAKSVEICRQLAELLPPTTFEYISKPDMQAKLCRAFNNGETKWE